MTTEVIIALIGVLSTITGSFTSWVFARKKYNSEVDNNLIENMKKSLDFYKQLSDDNRERLEEVLKRNENLEAEVAQLRAQVFDLMHSICFDLTCNYRKAIKPDANIEKKIKKDLKPVTRNEAESGKKVQAQ